MGGKEFIKYDPGSTAIQAVKPEHSLADTMSIAKFKQGIEQQSRSGKVQAREYFDRRMVSVNEDIKKHRIAKNQSSWDSDQNMRPWNEEIDGEYLQKLLDRKKDIEAFYTQTNERIEPTGGVQTIKKY